MAKKRKEQLTELQMAALKQVLRAKQAYWDSLREAEKAIGQNIGEEGLDFVMAGLEEPIAELTDAQLIEFFDLDSKFTPKPKE